MPTERYRPLRRRLTWSLFATLLLIFLSSTSTLSTESRPRKRFSLRLNEVMAPVVLWSFTAPAVDSSPAAGPRLTPPNLSTPVAWALPRKKPLTAEEDYLLALPFGREIKNVAGRHDLDALLLASIVEAESSFRADAVSPKGALGLMQLMPLHFKDADAPLDPERNLELGASYLGSLQERFDGDLALALAAYHAGPGTVERYGGMPPWRETQRYIDRVMSLYREHRENLAEGTAGGVKLAS